MTVDVRRLHSTLDLADPHAGDPRPDLRLLVSQRRAEASVGVDRRDRAPANGSPAALPVRLRAMPDEEIARWFG